MLFEEIKNTDCAFFDSHAHYYDERFYGEENPDGADALISLLFERGLLGAINVSSSYPAALKVIEQAKKFDKMYAAVGVHPEDLVSDGINYIEQIEKIRSLAENREENKIVAIGEIGLDYYWRQDNKPAQKDCFERQLALAEELSLPVIIHDREAHGDCFETVLRYPNVKGVFHSYSGSAEMATELVKRGWYISFSGVVTFKNASRVRDVLSTIPLDKLLIETDAPYLAPHPNRGKMNHSGNLEYTVGMIASVFGKTPEEIAEITYKNAEQIYNL